jgi:hypothetical protein
LFENKILDTDKSFEWKQKHRMGLKKPENPTNSSSLLPKMLSKRIDKIPDSADWSPWNSPVKDQSKKQNIDKFSTFY